MAESEFALVKEHLETVSSLPVSGSGPFTSEADLYFMLIDLAVLQYDEAALEQYAPLAEELAKRDGHILYQANAHRAWGVMHRLRGEYAAAETRLNQALELFQGLETRWQIGRTLFELAKAAQGRMDPAGTRDYFSQALASFEAIGAVPDAARTKAALEAIL
jgi:hypothetical protein